jgi:uncharacterized membrane-anchored protein
VVGYNLNSIG